MDIGLHVAILRLGRPVSSSIVKGPKLIMKIWLH